MGGSFAWVWWCKHTVPKGGRLFYARRPPGGTPGCITSSQVLLLGLEDGIPCSHLALADTTLAGYGATDGCRYAVLGCAGDERGEACFSVQAISHSIDAMDTNAPLVYFAGPLFSDAERTFNRTLTAEIESLGYRVFLPQRDGPEARENRALLPRHRRRIEIFETDYRHIRCCDVFLCILDGRIPDEGAAVELGLAYATRDRSGSERRIIGLHTDSRAAFLRS